MSLRAKTNKALKEILKYDNVVLLGESIQDPYGGAAKVTRGLSAKFSNKVLDMPISEEGIIGVASGLSLGGYIPIIEIMFYDFIPLCANQIFNNILKMKEIHNIPIKIIIRTMFNAGEEYGPTHSQDMDWLFKNTDQVKIATPNKDTDIYSLYIAAIYDDYPIWIIKEDKQLY